MDKKPDMRVALEDLPTHRDIALPAPFVQSAIGGMPMRQALERPADDENVGRGEAKLDLYGEGTSAFANGSLKGWVEVACSRCLGTARVPIDETLHITFLPRAEVPDDTVDAPLEETEEAVTDSEGDVDVYPYDGVELDLEPLLREQLVLAVPFAPLCREDCAGLCPQCGIDRNTGACTCEKPIDPRFAALKSLKV